ncbi:MAG: hypothetical protein AB8B50_11640 [Pirellulaceae bacterium]
MMTSQRRFAEVVSGFAENGLDLVIVFDSMSEETENLKTNLSEVGKPLFAKLPKTRISVVFYRDKQDVFAFDGLPLRLKARRVAFGVKVLNQSNLEFEWYCRLAALSHNQSHETSNRVFYV